MKHALLRVTASAIVITVLSITSISVAAQWIRYPTAGVPRTRDGKPISQHARLAPPMASLISPASGKRRLRRPGW